MADRALSGLLLIVAAVFGAYLFFRKQSAGAAVMPAATSGGGPPVLPPVGGKVTVSGTSPLAALLAFAGLEHLTVTSGEKIVNGQDIWPTSGHKEHNPTHPAIDVGTRGLSLDRIKQIIADAVGAGFQVLPENYTGQGRYGYSTGPHLHIRAPLSHFAQVAP